MTPNSTKSLEKLYRILLKWKLVMTTVSWLLYPPKNHRINLALYRILYDLHTTHKHHVMEESEELLRYGPNGACGRWKEHRSPWWFCCSHQRLRRRLEGRGSRSRIKWLCAWGFRGLNFIIDNQFDSSFWSSLTQRFYNKVLNLKHFIYNHNKSNQIMY